jgi:hypothetical protein
MTKQIYRITPNNRLDVIEAIRQAPDWLIVELRPEDRTAAQNRFYWATLNQISDCLRPTGRTYSADTWHEYLKTMFLHTMMIELPNGDLKEVERTTTNLNKQEFADYITQVLSWANDNGVYWNDSMYDAYNHTEMKR